MSCTFYIKHFIPNTAFLNAESSESSSSDEHSYMSKGIIGLLKKAGTLLTSH